MSLTSYRAAPPRDDDPTMGREKRITIVNGFLTSRADD
jgi:hypothetical protein